MLVESILLKIFATPDENPQEISDKFLKILPFDLAIEHLSLNRKTVTGFNQQRMVIFQLKLTKKKHTRVFLEYFKNKLSNEVKVQLLETLEKRVDDDCKLYIRLNKVTFLYHDQYELTSDGLCLHITIHVRTFPKRKENALQEIRNYLTSDIPIK